MSNSDSFIEEVTEEVQRERLFGLMKRYGWIAVLVVLAIVGGTAWREYRIAAAQTEAQVFGDAILSALEQEAPADRVNALQSVTPAQPGADAVLAMLIAAEAGSDGDDAAAIAQLTALSNNAEVPLIYRQIASYKALTRGADQIAVEERRAGFEALAVPGQPLRLLAEEQLALIELETGEKAAALTRLQAILADSEITSGLRRRASQLIVALGGALDQG